MLRCAVIVDGCCLVCLICCAWFLVLYGLVCLFWGGMYYGCVNSVAYSKTLIFGCGVWWLLFFVRDCGLLGYSLCLVCFWFMT